MRSERISSILATTTLLLSEGWNGYENRFDVGKLNSWHCGTRTYSFKIFKARFKPDAKVIST